MRKSCEFEEVVEVVCCFCPMEELPFSPRAPLCNLSFQDFPFEELSNECKICRNLKVRCMGGSHPRKECKNDCSLTLITAFNVWYVQSTDIKPLIKSEAVVNADLEFLCSCTVSPACDVERSQSIQICSRFWLHARYGPSD